MKHHKLMPTGRVCCGMFTVGFGGMYVQESMSPVELPTGWSPLITDSTTLVELQMKRDVESTPPFKENRKAC